jgi:hypothetical protein
VASLLSAISALAPRYYRPGNLESGNRSRLYLISIRLVYCVIPSVVSPGAAQGAAIMQPPLTHIRFAAAKTKAWPITRSNYPYRERACESEVSRMGDGGQRSASLVSLKCTS